MGEFPPQELTKWCWQHKGDRMMDGRYCTGCLVQRRVVTEGLEQLEPEQVPSAGWGGGRIGERLNSILNVWLYTHEAVHSSPLLVASPTGYVISTPSSIHTGMSGRAKNPNMHRDKAMFTDWCSSLAICKKKKKWERRRRN